jgi:hypothetical protein
LGALDVGDYAWNALALGSLRNYNILIVIYVDLLAAMKAQFYCGHVGFSLQG